MTTRWKRTLAAPALLLALYGICRMARVAGMLDRGDILQYGPLLLSGSALGYAMLRVAEFSPDGRPAYGRWLAFTPWTSKQPLPLGPAHLTVVDAAVVAIPVLLSWELLTSEFGMSLHELRLRLLELGAADPLMSAVAYLLHPAIPAVAFMLLYLVPQCLSLAGAQRPLPTLALLAALPFAVYPVAHPLIALAALAGVYVVWRLEFKRHLAEFPWNTRHFQTPQPGVEPKLGQLQLVQALGWPYAVLQPRRRELPQVTVASAILIALLVTWWVHVSAAVVVDARLNQAGTILLAAFAAFCRIILYLDGCPPPLSLKGRIKTRRWLIPRYDQVWLAPASCLLAAWVIPPALAAIGVPAVLAADLGLCASIVLALAMPPSLETWRLTGAHHFSDPRRSPFGRSALG